MAELGASAFFFLPFHANRGAHANGGADVLLTSSDPATASVPSGVKVKGGDTSATFAIKTFAVTAPEAIVISGFYGGLTQSSALTVIPASALRLTFLTLNPAAVVSGGSSTGTVTISAPAPSGGILISLAVAHRNVATVPPSVLVPGGATSASFAIAAATVHNNGKSTEVRATYAGVTQTAVLTVTPAMATTEATTPVAVAAIDPAETQAAHWSIGQWLASRRTALGLSVSARYVETASTLDLRRYSLYTPELNLLAETAVTTSSAPIAYEYVWFAGQPLVQIETATNTAHYYFNDHLGTPILTTAASGTVDWRVEYEPYGTVYTTLTGPTRHQPLRFPGQEAADGDRAYNIFRWYRAGWGQYTQPDPAGLISGGIALYAYADDDPIGEIDPLGLFAQLLCREVTVNGLPLWKKAIVKAYKPVHCRLRVKCGCGSDSFDTTVGREWKDPVYKLTNEPFSPTAFPGSVWTSYPVDGTGPSCEFEKCVLKAFKAQQDHPGLVPTYSITGPNSNTFVHDLIKQCGGSAGTPPKSKGYNWPD